MYHSFILLSCRIQSQVKSESLKYRNSFQTLSLIIKEEGFGSIYKGFRPKAIRMGVGGAVAMTTFEFVVALML
jgi:solute carrier family 25, member 33/36